MGTLISGATGTVIGDFTNGSGAFDGTTSQTAGAGASKGGTPASGVIGKDWGSGVTKTIDRYRIYDPSNEGWTSSGVNVTFELLGNSSNDTSTAVVLHTSPAQTYTIGTVNYDATSGIDQSTAYRYHWIRMTPSGSTGAMYIAEIEFYEADPGQPAVKRMGGVPFASPNRGVW